MRFAVHRPGHLALAHLPCRRPAPRSRLTGAAVAALAVALGATAGGCSAGFDPAVSLVQPANVDAQIDDLLARGLALVKAEGAESAALVGALVNRGKEADTLTRIAVGGEGSPPKTVSLGLQIPAGGLVSLGGAGGGQVLIGAAGDLRPGDFVPVTLSFRNAGNLEVQLLVEDAKDIYETYAPRPTGTATPGETASPGATGSPEATATATPAR